MARNDTTPVTLRHAVVFGAGVKARTEAAGTTLTVPREIADELVAANAARPVQAQVDADELQQP